MPSNVMLSFAGLSDGVVSVPVTLDGRLGIVRRAIIIMGAFANPPEVKALPSFFGDKGCSAVTVYMPFSDIAGFLTGPTINFADGDCFGIQRFVVVEDAVSQPV